MTERSSKTPAESVVVLSEIVGEENLAGQRMQAGAILDLMDIAAGRTAMAHSGTPVVTLSFDRVELLQPIIHLDLVRMEGRVVQVGNSSMMVCVDVSRQDAHTREFIPIQRSFITMVAVDANGRPDKTIPTLRLESDADRALHAEALEHKRLAQLWRESQAAAAQRTGLRADEVEEPENRGKREYLRPAETAVTVRRVFMPRNMNQLGTIFGGDILIWMDRVAIHTARLFTRNRNVVSLAMNHILFDRPILTTDLVEMSARVTYVRKYTLEVEIAVAVQRMDGTRETSHTGMFTVLNYDDSGFKRPIVAGLRLEDADQEGLKRYHLARERHRFWREHHAPASERHR